MLRITILAALAATCLAQNAEELVNRPPADVDKALRDRVTEFYGYHISREYRKAEALVAEDTKDYFYANNKPHYLKCEIRQVKYSDEFKQAQVMTMCSMFVMVPGFTDRPMSIPIGSTWKIEDGRWVWYVSDDARRASPFGKMTPGPYPKDGAQQPEAIPPIPTSPDFLYGLIKIDKDTVELKPGESAQITITNTAPGPMTVQVSGKITGIEAALDNGSLKANAKAVLTVKAGDAAVSGTLTIFVTPIQQSIPIHVNVK